MSQRLSLGAVADSLDERVRKRDREMDVERMRQRQEDEIRQDEARKQQRLDAEARKQWQEDQDKTRQRESERRRQEKVKADKLARDSGKIVKYDANHPNVKRVKGKASRPKPLARTGRVIQRAGDVASQVGRKAGPVLQVIAVFSQVAAVTQMFWDIFNAGDEAARQNAAQQEKMLSAYKSGADPASIAAIAAGNMTTEQFAIKQQIALVMQAIAQLGENQKSIAEGLVALSTQVAEVQGDIAPLKNELPVISANTQDSVRATDKIERKLAQVNFAQINNNAKAAAETGQWTRQKLGQVNFAQINNNAKAAAETGQWTRQKLGQVNFAQINNNAQWTRDKLGQVNFASIANDARYSREKLAQVNFAGNHNSVMTAIGKLAVPNLTPVTAQLNRIEAKVNQPQTVNPNLTTQLNRIEAKVNQPQTVNPNLTTQLNRIEAKVNQPQTVNFPPDLARKSDIANIKLPAVQLPPDLAKKSDIVSLQQSHATTHAKLNQLLPALAAIPAVIGGLAIFQQIKSNTDKIPALQSSINTVQETLNKTKEATTRIVVKVWDSSAKRIGLRNISVPASEAESTQLIANELAESQEDSYNDREAKKTKLQKIADSLQLQRIFQAVNTVLTLHNAAMLSVNLSQTVGSLISNGLAAVGIKNEDGTEIDINALVGKGIEDLLKQILGEDNYNGVKTNFLKANRVVSTAANIYWSVQSIADSTRNIAEFTASNTGKIGNALKKYRVVGENAYPWMAENVTARTATQAKLDRLIEGIGNVEGAASEIDGVVGEVRSIQDQVKDLGDQRKEFEDSLKDLQPKVKPDNVPVKTNADASKSASTGEGDIAKSTLDQTEETE